MLTIRHIRMCGCSWLLILTLTASCCGCGKDMRTRMLKRHKAMETATVSEAIYRRDSTYIALTSKSWNKEQIERYGNPIEISVESLYYSPGHLKLFAIVVHTGREDEEFLEPGESEYFFYSGTSYVGFRDRVGEPWQMYELFLYTAFDQQTAKEAAHLVRSFYEVHFKDIPVYVLDEQGESKLVKYGANLGDPEFWTSLLWTKGQHLPGYYIFQTALNPGENNSEKARLWEVDPVEYPQELLDQFALEK